MSLRPDWSWMTPRRMVIALTVAVLAFGAYWLLSPSSTTPSSGSHAADTQDAASAPGELVGAPSADAESSAQSTRVAPIAEADPKSDTPKYSAESIPITSAKLPSQVRMQRAVTALETATDGVHACVAKAQVKHERLGGTGPADPLLCVYEHTGMANEPGPVRFDIATLNGYSYYVDVSGTILRYSEFDGKGCRSTDGLAGCGSW